MFHALAVPERRRLRGDGAEDGGGAEEDEGAVHGALRCLVEIGGTSWARMVSERLPGFRARVGVWLGFFRVRVR